MIAGLEPCSFIDFPGKLAAVVFVQGCNLRCPYCHNARLIEGTPERPLSKETLIAWFARRKARLQGVVISGGEPTLWPELEGFLGEVRALGYQTKLDTNGTRPSVLRRLLEQSLLDYVAMDLKDVPERYEQWLCSTSVAEAVRESIRLLQASSIAHEFRTTLEATRHDVETVTVLRQLIADAPWYLQSQTPTKRARNTPFASNELQHLVSRVEALAHGPVHLRRTGTG